MTDSVNWPALYEIGLLNIYDFISQDKPFPEAKHYPRRVCGQVLRENNRDPAERRREPARCIGAGSAMGAGAFAGGGTGVGLGATSGFGIGARSLRPKNSIARSIVKTRKSRASALYGCVAQAAATFLPRTVTILK